MTKNVFYIVAGIFAALLIVIIYQIWKNDQLNVANQNMYSMLHNRNIAQNNKANH